MSLVFTNLQTLRLSLESKHKSCLIKMEIAKIQLRRHRRTSSGAAEQTEEVVYIIKNASACRVETPARQDIAIRRGKQNYFSFFFFFTKSGME